MAKRKRLGAVVIEKIGKWDGTLKALEELGPRVPKAARKAQSDLAKDMKDALIRHIQAQDLNWPRLRPKTLMFKALKGRSNKIYLDTETYINAITIHNRQVNVVSVGILKNTQYKGRKDRSVTVDQVALWMEYGTRRMAARPLWGPTIKEFGGASGIRDKIATAIFEEVKKIVKKGELTVTYKQIRSMKSWL